MNDSHSNDSICNTSSTLRQAQVRALALHVRWDIDHRWIGGGAGWWEALGITRRELGEVIDLAVRAGYIKVEVQRMNTGSPVPVLVPTEVELPEPPKHLWAWQQREAQS